MPRNSSRLTPELKDHLLDENNRSDISDISEPLSFQSDSNADNSISDLSTPPVSRENSIGPILIPEEEQEVRQEEQGAREEEQEEIMVVEDSIVDTTFDDLTGTEVRLEGQQILCFYCWDGLFYECNATIKRPANGGKPSICGPAGAVDFILKVR